MSNRRDFMAKKLLDFLQLTIVQLLRKFHRNILFNEGKGGDFLGRSLESSQNSQTSIIGKKGAKFEYFVNFFCSIVF